MYIYIHTYIYKCIYQGFPEVTCKNVPTSGAYIITIYIKCLHHQFTSIMIAKHHRIPTPGYFCNKGRAYTLTVSAGGNHRGI